MTRAKTVACVLLALAAAGCAVNPVTGQKEFMLYSESQEIELGQQTDVEVGMTYGIYEDPVITAYITRMGQALAAKGQRPDLPWRFTVLDSPVVNAFAVPGGSVYVTRGILALIGSEAELAAVLGHEIGHVNARHSMSQMSKQQVAQIGLALGSAVSKEFAKYAGLAGTGVQVLFLKFSRDNENQADGLGVDYARADGYNPADMAVTFTALQKLGDLSGGSSSMPGFLSTHPLTADRIAHVHDLLQPSDAGLARNADAYLLKIENLVYGDDPRQGFIENGVFYHPTLRFQFTVPSGWAVENMPTQVQLVAADKNAALLLQAAKFPDAADVYLRMRAEEITQSGGKALDDNQTTINNGLTCYEQAFKIPQKNADPVRMTLSCVKKGNWVYAFRALSSASGTDKYEPDFKRVVASFKELTDASRINRPPRRLIMIKANGTDSLQNILKKAGMPESSWQAFAILNGLELTAVPAAGRLIKTVR
jgi:predicted Zn-dependent protease